MRLRLPIAIFGLTIFLLIPSLSRADSIIVFDASGTFNGGTSLTGTVTIDITTGLVTAADLTTTGTIAVGPLTILVAQEVSPVDADAYVLGVEDSLGDAVSLAFPTNNLLGYTGGNLCGDTLENCLLPPAFTTFAVSGIYPEGAAHPTILLSGSLTATPEPSTLILLGSGLMGLMGMAYRRKKLA